MTIVSLPSKHLRWTVPSGLLGFDTTAEVEPSEAVIGQDNALAGLRRGVEMRSPGFNVFVVGLSTSGRLDTVRRILTTFAPRRWRARDLVYVRNFPEPSRPRLLELPPGRGLPFRRELLRIAGALVEEVPRMLATDEVRRARERGAHDAAVAAHEGLGRLRAHARERGFVVGDVGEEDAPDPVVFWVQPRPGAEGVVPAGEEADDDPVHTRAELQVLAAAGELELPRPLADILADFDGLERELEQVRAASRRALIETVRTVSEAEAEAVQRGTAALFTDLSRRWPAARAWLADLRGEIVESPEWFEDDSDHAELIAAFTANVVHVGSRGRKAPIVVVPNPTWQNLFGGVETGEGGAADHRSIRAGALQDADGGFLVLSANDLLQEPASWKVLKRALMFGEVDVQNAAEGVTGGTPVLRPDAMRLDVKVVLLGDPDTFAMLYYGDPDFGNVFKIKAEFEPDAPIAPALLEQYAAFVSRVIRREKLQHFSRDAVCAVLEWAVRESGRGGRISTNFGNVADLVREASFEATALPTGARGPSGSTNQPAAGHVDVRRDHVAAALLARRRRDDLAERRVLEMLDAALLRVDVAGARVGQINALVVYHVGGHDFGRPMRITCAVGAGRGGLVSIERVARMSGRSHDKGVKILEGFLLERFGREGRLCFTSTLCFEQSYSKVDGDSATLSEALALLSALGSVPIRQDVAITGSLNQFGEVQPVGGVNEKIEGFFKACAQRGLTGTQGVAIPDGNRADLCLAPEVTAACAEGSFHVWTVASLAESVELCMGVRAGERVDGGGWTEGSVFARVSAELASLRAMVRPRGAR